ncbi:MAG: 23S rRNA (adenine(2030)-N(6))-methyltransferase RlmJ, partial [Alphaproteobacteria bacterium]|nr:23S rRNA (adenine(2030)-N(6))-methyltransferase RlmJ [Alphaproteobacteria bacterium]
VSRFGAASYPGSPLIAALLLRPQDRLVAIEKHPEEFAALRQVLRPFKRARAVEADGYQRLPALLPPAERRGLVLIDPPYESPDEFAAAARAVKAVLTRFATAAILIWFPIKSMAAADAFCGEVKAQGAAKLLRVEFRLAPPGDRLTACGLLIVNPPFGFDHEMAQALEHLAPLLGAGMAEKWRVSWLSGAK